MQVPQPHIVPMILLGMAIPDNLDASILTAYSHQIIDGLSKRGIHVVSYSCDGTETERSVQRLLISRSERQISYAIPHPLPSLPALTLRLPVFGDRPTVMVQDNKHGLKTARNNLFSGARLLVTGGYSMGYSDVRELAYHDNSPLFIRDVEKLDRQDDNAAMRLFSSATLDFVTKLYPERRALIVYLFVLADLHDAYQNRCIPHIERVRMVLRAHYFIGIWRGFLDSAGYSQSRYFLSREAADIMNILVEGYLGLLYAYRDHMDGHIYPLLPWLHSSETCEHVFAECRKLVKDFSYLDFLFAVPRITVLLRTAMALKHTTDARDRAAGYAHTYFDSKGIDLVQLSTLPTDAHIMEANQQAWGEAESLWNYLGVVPDDILHCSMPLGTPRVPKLPGIASWFTPGQDFTADVARTSNSGAAGVVLVAPDEPRSLPSRGPEDDDEISDSDITEYEVEPDAVTEATELQALFDAEEVAPLRSTAIDDRMMALRCAAVALSLDDISYV